MGLCTKKRFRKIEEANITNFNLLLIRCLILTDQTSLLRTDCKRYLSLCKRFFVVNQFNTSLSQRTDLSKLYRIKVSTLQYYYYYVLSILIVKICNNFSPDR